MSNEATRRPILVGFDASELSMAALDWALDEAARRDLPVHVMTARGVPLAAAPSLVEPSLFPEEQAEQIVETAKKHARESHPGVHVAGSTAIGSPAASLVRASSEASMVVVGRGRHSPVGEAILGSTSAQVGAHAKCPVIVLDSDAAQASGGAVVVGVDGSEANEPALAFAFEEAATRGTELVAVHAWWIDVPDRSGVDSISQQVRATLLQSQEALLTKALDEPSRQYPDIVVRQVVSQDRPVDALIEAGESASLVVVGSRGHGGFVGLLLGSVSQGLLHRQHPCPIAVVHTRG